MFEIVGIWRDLVVRVGLDAGVKQKIPQGLPGGSYGSPYDRLGEPVLLGEKVKTQPRNCQTSPWVKSHSRDPIK